MYRRPTALRRAHLCLNASLPNCGASACPDDGREKSTNLSVVLDPCHTRILIVILACSTLPIPAVGQSDDGSYCAELGKLALRYTGSTRGQGRLSPDLSTLEAIDDCRKGNTAAGIPVLEKLLRSQPCQEEQRLGLSTSRADAANAAAQGKIAHPRRGGALDTSESAGWCAPSDALHPHRHLHGRARVRDPTIDLGSGGLAHGPHRLPHSWCGGDQEEATQCPDQFCPASCPPGSSQEEQEHTRGRLSWWTNWLDTEGLPRRLQGGQAEGRFASYLETHRDHLAPASGADAVAGVRHHQHERGHNPSRLRASRAGRPAAGGKRRSRQECPN